MIFIFQRNDDVIRFDGTKVEEKKLIEKIITFWSTLQIAFELNYWVWKVKSQKLLIGVS